MKYRSIMTLPWYHRSPRYAIKRSREYIALPIVVAIGVFFFFTPLISIASLDSGLRMDDLSRGLEKLESILDGSEPGQLDLLVLRRITKNFSDERKIGRGGCATVYKGILPKSGRIVAVKKLLSVQTVDDEMFIRELTTMNVQHPNIVRFIGYCSNIVQEAMQMTGKHILADQREMLICFEYISKGSLEDYITDELRGLEWHKRFQIIRGICEGLRHLHEETKIIHMDLKPGNILLDDDFVSKITDFGISRPWDASKDKSENLMCSIQYCAPEYKLKGEMSNKLDIYSLGVIIKEMVTGSREEPHVATVHRRWRHRWKNVKHTTSAYHQQLDKCLELVQRCNYDDSTKRPDIAKITRELNEIDCTCIDISDASKPNIEQQKSSFLEDMLEIEPLELHFSPKLKMQTSHSIQLTNDTNDYIAFRILEENNMALVSTTRQIPFWIHPSKDVVSPRSSYIVTVTSEALKKPLREKCVAKFYVQSTRVDKGLTIKDITADMFKEGLDKVVDVVMVSMRAQHVLAVDPPELRYGPIEPNKHLPCSLQLINVTDDNVAFTFILPQGKVLCYPEMGMGIMPPRSTQRVIMDMLVEEEEPASMQCKDTCLLRSLIVDRRVYDVSMELFDEQTGVHGTELDIVFGEQPQTPSPVLGSLELTGDGGASLISSLSMKTELLHIYPSEVRFVSEGEKAYISLINKTDDEVTFILYDGVGRYRSRHYDHGVVLPRSTRVVCVIFEEKLYQVGVMMISGNCTAYDNYLACYFKSNREELMKQVRAKGAEAYEAVLACVVGRAPNLGNKQQETVIEVSMFKNGLKRLCCMDVHPKEPWIVTSHDDRTLCLWKIDKTSASCIMMCRSSTLKRISSVKFIARIQWIVCGDMEGYIIVYTYADNALTEIKKFQAHKDEAGALAVHPTLPYLLSSSNRNLKLWDFDQGWMCTREFSCSSGRGMWEIAFSSEDGSTFASHGAGEMKIWSIDSQEPVSCLPGLPYTIAYCNTGSDQCLAAFIRSQKIEILGLRSNTTNPTPVNTLDMERPCLWYGVAFHPTRPLLAAWVHEEAFLWNYTTHGLRKVHKFDKSDMYCSRKEIGFIDLEGFQRLVIGHGHKIEVVDIGI